MSPPYPYFARGNRVAGEPFLLTHTGRLPSEPTDATPADPSSEWLFNVADRSVDQNVAHQQMLPHKHVLIDGAE